MQISITVYVISALLLLWGGKFAGFGKYHEDFMDLEVTKSLGGFAAYFVIWHHISQEQVFQDAGIVHAFVQIGFYLVALFFFCSGYGLIKSLCAKPDYLKGFIKKRLPVIIVPFYVSAILYTIYRLAIGELHHPVQIVLGLLGFVMVNEYAWYPIILTILYLAFYLIFKRVKKVDTGILLMALLVILLGLIFCVNGHFTWWAKEGNWWMNGVAREWWMEEKVWWLSGEWWVNSPIAFVLGMLFANHEKGIVERAKKLYGLKLVLLLVATVVARRISMDLQGSVGYWSEWSGRGPGITDKMICFAGQLPEVITFTVLIFFVMMKYYVKNPVSKFFGDHSYEFYMMNLLALRLCRPILAKSLLPSLGAVNLNYVLFMVAVFAVSILLGMLYKRINKPIIKKLQGL